MRTFRRMLWAALIIGGPVALMAVDAGEAEETSSKAVTIETDAFLKAPDGLDTSGLSVAQKAPRVDVIIVGASEIAEPLPQLIAEYPDIFWYCNCGAGFPENPGLAQSLDDGSEINYTAGVATALLLQDAGGDQPARVGGQAAGEGGEGEQGDAAHEEPAPAEDVAGAATE